MLQSPRQSSPESFPTPDPVPVPVLVPSDTSTAQAPVGAQANLPIFRTFHHNVLWHLWTVISVVTAVILIYINFVEHVIGPELGRRKSETKAVLNILLFVAKTHEIAIVLSLANLARQLIQSALISKKGTILALVGAEQATSAPGVLISNGYASALKYGLRYFSSSSRNESRTVRSRRRVVLAITGFLLISAALCATVGPSSAVLMVPAQQWFLQKTLTQKDIIQYLSQTTSTPVDDFTVRPGYPYIFISPLEITGAENLSDNIDWGGAGSYWNSFGAYAGQTFGSIYVQDIPEKTHTLEIYSVRVSVNSSTTLDRSLTIDAKWDGETKFATVLLRGVSYAGLGNITYNPTPRNNPSPTRFITELTAVTSSTVCRRKQRLACEGQRTPISASAINTTQWCFEAATSVDESSPPLFSKEDLLLLVDYPASNQTASNDSSLYPNDVESTDDDKDFLPRFWITEGPGLSSRKDYTDSILFVFEFAREDLIVCTNTASLTSATATLAGQLYDVYQANYHTDLEYEYENGTVFKKNAKSFLFRKGWLDYEHSLGGAREHAYVLQPNTTDDGEYDPELHKDFISTLLSKPRSDRRATQTEDLRLWAEKLVKSTNRAGGSIWQPLAADIPAEDLERVNRQLADNNMAEWTNITDASTVEVVVGGPWITLLSLIGNGISQYQIWHPDYGYTDTNTSLPRALFLDGSLIEEIEDYRFLIFSPVLVHHHLYGYRVASATGKLAVAVLITYMVIACCGSIWQLSRGGDVIIAWGSVPEYLLLGEGTAAELGRLGYANVGGKSKTRFECGVRVDRAAGGDYYGIKLGDVEVSEVPVR